MPKFSEGDRVKLNRDVDVFDSVQLPRGALGTYIGNHGGGAGKFVIDSYPCNLAERLGTKHWVLLESYFDLVEEIEPVFRVGTRSLPEEKKEETPVTTTEEATEVAVLLARLAASAKELADFKATVVRVAMQKADENDWCDVVADTLNEMGLGAELGEIEVETEYHVKMSTNVTITHKRGESVTQSMIVGALEKAGFYPHWIDDYDVNS